LGNDARPRFLADTQEGALPSSKRPWPICEGARRSSRNNLDLGLADASVIAVAERIGTDRILTVDLGEFRVIGSAYGKPFRLLAGERAL
jgi:hypothetical protein